MLHTLGNILVVKVKEHVLPALSKFAKNSQQSFYVVSNASAFESMIE